jgi:L-glutamine:2-deoxy-scyllo-inosose/3-amino-2,3-dideoxy-scyllo-inosose aminotransferase
VELLALNGGSPVRSAPYPWPIHGAEEKRLLLQVLDSGRWSFDGPMEAALARTLSDYLNVPYALLVSSGTVALELAIEALGIHSGDEVILPALTWTAPALAIVNAGAVPVFVDVSPDDWCIDPVAVEAAVTPRTRAILVVHTYSHMADMDRLLALGDSHGIAIVEDCAHAHGSRWKGRPAGTMGAIGCFSFQQSKTLTAGEGGLVVTASPALADRLYGLKNCGRKRTEDSPFGFGGNHRITEFQSAVLLAQLGRLDAQIEAKSCNIALFEQAVKEIPGLHPLPVRHEVTSRNLFGLSLRVDLAAFGGRSTRLLAVALAAEGVPVFVPHDVVYRSPMWLAGLREPRFAGDGRRSLGLDSNCPQAEAISDHGGLVIAHEAFLGSEADVQDLLNALRKVSRLAHSIPVDARETRRI